MREKTKPEPTKPNRWERFGRGLDQAILAIAPSWGDRRIAARTKRLLIDRQLQRIEQLGHPSMHHSESRDYRFIGNRQSTDDQLEESLVDMQHRSREMTTTNPHASGAIEGRVAHEIGVGLSCRPEIHETDAITDDEAQEANQRLAEVCREWSEYGVDRQRQFSLAQIQRIAQRTYAGFGEVFLLLREAPYSGPIGLTVEIVNPLRVQTPPEFRNDENVRLGIRYHPTTEQIQGYYVLKTEHKYGYWSYDINDYEYFPRYDAQGMQRVCHIFEPILPDQSRGIPWLMSAIPFLKDIDDFHEAELINKQVEACLGVIIKGKHGQQTPLDVAQGNSTDTDGAGNRIEELYPGMVHYADEDGDISVIDPSRPGGNFAPFIEAGLRAVSAAANYPYEVLAKNFFRTTYSSGRLAMLDGKLGFDMRRDVLVTMGMRPVWRRIVNDSFFHGLMEGIATRVSYLANRYQWERHAWGGDSFGSVDPEKEIKAHEIGLETGQETLAEIHAEKNKNWRDSMKQRHVELKQEIEYKVEREKFEMELREAAGLPMPNEDPEGDQGENNQPQGQPSNASA